MQRPRTTDRRKTGVLRASAIAMLLMAGSVPAAPQAGTEGAATDAWNAAAGDSEIERFCSNIADAARDRRYAMQASELAALRREVDQRIALLEERKAEYEAWLSRREEFMARAQESVVAIYADMRADAAAERLAELDAKLAAAILLKLDARKAAVILNEMERKAAAMLTGIMASAARSSDRS